MGIRDRHADPFSPPFSPLNRCALHRAAVDAVEATLQAQGHRCARRHSRNGTVCDLLVDDGLRIGVLAAIGYPKPHRVRVHGHAYTYTYVRREWNLHRHGRLPTVPPDVWVLVGMTADESVCDLYVVPAARLAGHKTIQLLESRTARPRRHQLMPYRAAWELVR